MFVRIYGDFFEQTKKQANATSKKEFDDSADSKDFIWDDLHSKIEDIGLEEQNKLRVSVNNELGYFSLLIPLPILIQVKLLENLAKATNKMKTMLEATQ